MVEAAQGAALLLASVCVLFCFSGLLLLWSDALFFYFTRLLLLCSPVLVSHSHALSISCLRFSLFKIIHVIVFSVPRDVLASLGWRR